MSTDDRGDRFVAVTRAQRKINEAVQRHGLEVDSMEYQPTGAMVEMSGREGGWLVFVKGYGVARGYTWAEVVEQIDRLAPMWKDGLIYG